MTVGSGVLSPAVIASSICIASESLSMSHSGFHISVNLPWPPGDKVSQVSCFL